jgi:photosystem II stability/assembly factor-like uncharacterized protein
MRRLIAVAAGLAALAGPAAAAAAPPTHVTARRLQPRAGAVAPGTRVGASALFGTRVFANARVGIALAGVGQAQYPARTTDGGTTWRIDGPQFHVNAADAPEAVTAVGVAGPKRLFAYGSQVVDATTDAGRTWWESFFQDLVVAVVPGRGHRLVAYVQHAVGNHAATSQYVSRDGGRHWRLSTAFGGG